MSPFNIDKLSGVLVQDRLQELEFRVTENTALTLEIKNDVQDVQKDIRELRDASEGVISAFQAAAGAFAVLAFFGRLAQPLVWIGAVVGSTALTVSAYKSTFSVCIANLFK